MPVGIRAMASRAAPIRTPTGGRSAVAVAVANPQATVSRRAASLLVTSSVLHKDSVRLRDNGLRRANAPHKQSLPGSARKGAAAMAPRWPGSKRAPAAAKTV